MTEDDRNDDQSLTLSPAQAPWIGARRLGTIMRLLKRAGGETRFVGGCVRNAVLGLPSTDIDLATTLAPEAVMGALRDAGMHVVPTGLKHGTVTVIFGNRKFEVTTLRRDVTTDGRHAVVTFTDDWREDAARRDFTINAMSADENGRLFDYFGGFEDAMAGRVRFVGDAGDRIREDYLRILRFFRIHAWYGRQQPCAATLRAIASNVDGLQQLAVERITQETMRLLDAEQPVEAWQAMMDTGVVAALLGDTAASDVPALKALAGLDRKLGDGMRPLRRLAALSAPGRAVIGASRLRLSRRQAAYLAAMDEALPIALSVPDSAGARALAYRFGPHLAADALLVARARGAPAPGGGAVRGWVPPSLPLGGDDVVALGVAGGPEVGALLRRVEAWWIAGDFAAGRADCLAELRRLVSGNDGALSGPS